MKPFETHKGLVVPLDRPHIDTDQIIPKQFLKGTERAGYGESLFYDWRYRQDGSLDVSFPLNAPRYRGASVLVAGRNFGCGSSREHAPWALADFGFRVIIAPSFADIFATNCLKNGLLCIALDEAQVARLMQRACEVEGYELTADLRQCVVRDESDFTASFQIDPFRRQCLLQGLDDISFSQLYEADIAAYEARRPSWRESLSDI